MNEVDKSVLEATLEIAKLLEESIMKREIITNIQYLLDEYFAD